ncbi:MAG: hypothetical protein B6241_13245 [Spirochaetaceae bacterium 4572_59]|nr:MAG: hypothetical protein B6241_13245 [Spirochaetaceae bacterium 4572_59]
MVKNKEVIDNVYAWNARKQQFTTRQINLALDVLRNKNWIKNANFLVFQYECLAYGCRIYNDYSPDVPLSFYGVWFPRSAGRQRDILAFFVIDYFSYFLNQAYPFNLFIRVKG